jgi:tetratricopeptide (TPR) repeat protein
MLCALDQSHVQLHIRLPDPEVPQLKQALIEDYGAVMEMLVRVQAEKTEAWKPEDQAMIHRAVAATVGFQALNEKIKEQLRAWCLSQAVQLVEQLEAEGEAQSQEFALLCESVATVVEDFGDHGRALRYYEKCLPIFETMDGGVESENVGVIYNNMAIAYKRQGKYTTALETYQKSLAIKLATLGEQHPRTADAYSNIAAVLTSQGQVDAALTYHQRCLAIRLATLGELHPDTAMAYSNMASAFGSQGKYDQALALYQKSLAITVATLREQHPETASIYSNISSVYLQQGKHAEALETLQKSMAIQLATLGEQHPETALIYSNFALVYDSQGKYEEALANLRTSLAIQLAVLGEQHPDTASSYGNLAGVLGNQGRYEEALEYYQRSLAIQLAVLGEQHPDTAATNINLALVNEKLRRLECTEKYLEAAVAALPAEAETPGLLAAWAFFAQGRLSERTGQLEQALQRHERALALRLQLLHTEHPDIAESLEGKGSVLGQMGQFDAAHTAFQEAERIRRASDHPVLGDLHFRWGQVLQAEKRHAEARTCFQKAHAAYRQRFGPDHSETTDAEKAAAAMASLCQPP